MVALPHTVELLSPEHGNVCVMLASDVCTVL